MRSKRSGMSAFNNSGPAEVLRAEQKDQEMCDRINRQLSEFLLKFEGRAVKNQKPSSSFNYRILIMTAFAGHMFLNKNKQYVHCASQILYYALTTLSKLQTLGEEYTKIVQVGKTGKHVPGLLVS